MHSEEAQKLIDNYASLIIEKCPLDLAPVAQQGPVSDAWITDNYTLCDPETIILSRKLKDLTPSEAVAMLDSGEIPSTREVLKRLWVSYIFHLSQQSKDDLPYLLKIGERLPHCRSFILPVLRDYVAFTGTETFWEAYMPIKGHKIQDQLFDLAAIIYSDKESKIPRIDGSLVNEENASIMTPFVEFSLIETHPTWPWHWHTAAYIHGNLVLPYLKHMSADDMKLILLVPDSRIDILAVMNSPYCPAELVDCLKIRIAQNSQNAISYPQLRNVLQFCPHISEADVCNYYIPWHPQMMENDAISTPFLIYHYPEIQQFFDALINGKYVEDSTHRFFCKGLKKRLETLPPEAIHRDRLRGTARIDIGDLLKSTFA